MVSSCLVPGPGMMQGRGNIGMACESSKKEVVGIVNYGLLGLQIKGMLSGKLLSLGISRLFKGQCLSESTSFQDAK